MHIRSICLVLALMCYLHSFLHGEHLKISDFPRVEVIFCILWDLPSAWLIVLRFFTLLYLSLALARTRLSTSCILLSIFVAN